MKNKNLLNAKEILDLVDKMTDWERSDGMYYGTDKSSVIMRAEKFLIWSYINVEPLPSDHIGKKIIPDITQDINLGNVTRKEGLEIYKKMAEKCKIYSQNKKDEECPNINRKVERIREIITNELSNTSKDMIISAINKKTQLGRLVEKTYNKGMMKLSDLFTGNNVMDSAKWNKINHYEKRMQKIVDILKRKYYDNPEKLRRYFNQSPKNAGIASSAYFELTGDITPIQSLKYGGLGVTLNDSKQGLDFSREQLQFSKIRHSALENAKLYDSAMMGSFVEPESLAGLKIPNVYTEKIEQPNLVYLSIFREYQKNIEKEKSEK